MCAFGEEAITRNKNDMLWKKGTIEPGKFYGIVAYRKVENYGGIE